MYVTDQSSFIVSYVPSLEFACIILSMIPTLVTRLADCSRTLELVSVNDSVLHEYIAQLDVCRDNLHHTKGTALCMCAFTNT